MPKRFVPAKLHGFLDFMTIGLFITGAAHLPRQGRAGLEESVPGDGRRGRDLQPDDRLRLRQAVRRRPGALDEAALPARRAFGIWVGLSPWVFGTWRKGWNYWAPQTLAMSSELFFALTTELDPD